MMERSFDPTSRRNCVLWLGTGEKPDGRIIARLYSHVRYLDNSLTVCISSPSLRSSDRIDFLGVIVWIESLVIYS